MDFSSISSTLYTSGTQSAESQAAAKAKGAAANITEASSEEEMKDAIKSFESYFVEQILKDVKETFTTFGNDDDKDASMSQMTDLFMDTVYQEYAGRLVDDIGGSLTQQLYEQMRRNYGITTVAPETNEEV